MHRIKFYSLLVVIGVTFFSCSKEDYEATIPTYISIPNITLTTDYVTEGSASSNITDAWVYINDDLMGVYELPAKFPVLKEGSFTLKVYAGIKDNGIAASRNRYLLYSHHEEEVNLVKGETIEINPTVTYSSGAKFAWIEDFDGTGYSLSHSAGSDTVINIQSNDVKEGANSGHVFLQDDMDFFEAISPGITTNLKNGRPVYLEMDFKTNEPLLTGLYFDTSQYAFITLNTSTEWKKIYINLTDLINNSGVPNELKVFFGIKEVSAPFLTSNPEIFIDNIKLVHF